MATKALSNNINELDILLQVSYIMEVLSSDLTPTTHSRLNQSRTIHDIININILSVVL